MKAKEENDVWGSEEPKDIFRSEQSEEKTTDEWIIPSDEITFLLNGKEQEKKNKKDIGNINVFEFMTNMLRKMGIKTCTIVVDGKTLLQKDAAKTNFDRIDTINVVTEPIKSKPVPDKILLEKEEKSTKHHQHPGIVGFHLKTDIHRNPEAQKAHDKVMKNH